MFLVALPEAWCHAGTPPGDGECEVRSIDLMDTESSDFQALGKAIADARIIMLGEQSHGDGSTFLAFTSHEADTSNFATGDITDVGTAPEGGVGDVNRGHGYTSASPGASVLATVLPGSRYEPMSALGRCHRPLLLHLHHAPERVLNPAPVARVEAAGSGVAARTTA